MAIEQNTGEEHIMNSNDLAFERTIMAENRTLMAWIRTAISMISFGFTIYKFFQEAVKTAGEDHRMLSPRKFAMIMICFGLLGLVWGMAEHRRMIKKLRKSYPALEKSNTGTLALLILLFGLVLFLAALFRQ